MFKQRKHKTFNYKPRFSEGQEIDNTKELENKPDFASRWKEGRTRKRRGGISIQVLIIGLVLLLICIYLLDSKIN